MGGIKNTSGMTVFRAALALAMALVAVSAFAAQAEQGGDKDKPKRIIHGKPADRHAIEMLLDESDGDAEVAAGKTISELKGRFKLDKSKPVEEAAVDFIDRHRNAFGLKNPKDELKLIKKVTTQKGMTYVHLQQTYNGVPVWQKIVTVHLDKDEDIDRISSGNDPTPDIDTTPLVSADEALYIAKGNLKMPVEEKRFPSEVNLVIYENKLAYHVLLLVNEYFIDAKDGHIIATESMIRREPVSGIGERTFASSRTICA
jgi:Zn-dependent metalloprotease